MNSAKSQSSTSPKKSRKQQADSSTTGPIEKAEFNDVSSRRNTTNTLELSGFPSTFKTADLISIFHKYETQFRIKWIDDTHALIIFKDASIARAAYLDVGTTPFVRITPMKESGESFHRASESPSKQQGDKNGSRPITTDMVARRLIAGALGVKAPRKSTLELDQDKQKLKEAKG